MRGMICGRLKCPNRADRRGLCTKHYEAWCLQNPTVPAIFVAAHINRLRASGMTGEFIAQLASVSETAVYEISRGERAYVQSDVARRILDVGYVPIIDRSPGSRVPIIGTARRLRALVALGYTTRALENEIGYLHNNTSRLIHARYPYVLVATARSIDEAFRRLMFTPAPDTVPARVARERAYRAGWAPPLAWDDDIDDPEAIPDLGRVVATAEAVLDLRETDGLTDMQIANVLGIQVGSVQQAARRYERKLAS